jgi:hypothetical protein
MVWQWPSERPVANPAQSSDIENIAEFPDRSAYGTAFDPG